MRSLRGLMLILAPACAPMSPPSGAQAVEPAGPQAERIEAQPGVVLDRACSPSGPELCFDARDDNCNGIIDEGCGLSTGLVQFAVAWDEPTADVDLLVTDPNGELVEAARVAESGLVKERDCPGPEGACHGQNLENVYLEPDHEPLRGVYRVAIRLESLGDAEPPVAVTLGARVGPKSYAARAELSAPEEQRIVLFEL